MKELTVIQLASGLVWGFVFGLPLCMALFLGESINEKDHPTTIFGLTVLAILFQFMLCIACYTAGGVK